MSPSATVVGAGPNGLVAAVLLARAGWAVTVLEAAPTPGGGTRSDQALVAGVTHDVCSAVHPLGVASPVLRALPLEDHGLRWVHPPAPVAHVIDRHRAVVVERSVEETAAGLGVDARAYRRLLGPLVARREAVVDLVLGGMAGGRPASLDASARSAAALARLGLAGARSARGLAGRFGGAEARALLAGLAAHSVLPLHRVPSGAVGLLLGVLAHDPGWPVAEGGSQRIAEALVSLLEAHGGTVECGRRVEDLRELGDPDAVLADVAPGALAEMAGDRLRPRQRRALRRFRHGPGVCKVDWVLDGPIPWADPRVARAGTVHLGGTFEQVAAAEAEVWAGRHPEAPFVLLAQHTLFDPTRVGPGAPEGAHTVWAYCHTPVGSTVDVSGSIAAMVEAAAPGFRDRVVATRTMTADRMAAYNANYVGGDITGGIADLRQTVARPVASPRPWRTSVPGVYLCSSSTPPGGGVHGMCGWHAARCALADHRG